MKVLVTGADGQVGTEMVRLDSDEFRVVGVSRRELDITDRAAIDSRLDEHAPDLVVNCAAYTTVDRAEDEPELAYRVNANAVGWLGRACGARGIGVIHFSTDYVFDGTKGGPYVEDDIPNPLNVYGASKLAGENRLREATDQHLILRVGWVFGRIGRSFVDTILRLAEERDELTVVNDQIGTPTPAEAIADAVRSLAVESVVTDFRHGTYHYSTEPAVTRCAFAREIVAMAGEAGLLEPLPVVRGIPTAEWPARAQRPLNSRLRSSRLTQELGIRTPTWLPGLAAYLKQVFVCGGRFHQ